MIIGVPKEIKVQENRVALTPGGAQELVCKGHSVVVQTNAGAAIGFTDDQYEAAGAKIAPDAAAVFEQADMIVKVKEPQPVEYPLFRKGQLLFTYLHLAASESLTTCLAETGITGIAYETIDVGRRLPLLEPMSEVAGRMSVLQGANYLGSHFGGEGVLLSGVPGVLPGCVLILGGGTSGINAAKMAVGLGATVTVAEINNERMRYLDLVMPNVRTMYSSQHALAELLPQVDLLISSVLVPGAKAPRLVSREMMRLMRPGSVFVDISIDQGGTAETSRMTTHSDPVYVEEGVVHYCVGNMPGAYARTSTQALTNATFRYVKTLADHGLEGACLVCPELIGGINVMKEQVTNEAVASAHNLEFLDPMALMKN